jgi:hypothetical protein
VDIKRWRIEELKKFHLKIKTPAGSAVTKALFRRIE